MHKDGDEIHVTDTEASGGSKEGVVRWVLIIGTLLAVVILSLIWMGGAMTQGDVEEEATVSGEVRSMEEKADDTDSIVGVTDDGGEAGADTFEDKTTTEDGLSVIEN